VSDVDRIVEAVLYEGYILWPYRRAATKNRRRWTFGGVHPEAYSAQRGGDDPALMRAQCLLAAAGDATVSVRVRFLHVVERRVARRTPAGLEPVDELWAGGERHVAWEEAAEREIRSEPLTVGDLISSGRRLAIDVPAGSRSDDLRDDAGVLTRRWRALTGTVDIAATALEPGLVRLEVTVTNTTPWAGLSREETLKQTFCSTHIVLEAPGGGFVSLTDPPAHLQAAALGCANTGTWPVLAAPDPADDRTVLCSPIILPDHPQIAPESPGDLFDATEIDQMLVLNILAMTDDERREMRDSDPRARAILERTEALTEEELLRLHGTIREFGMVRR